ncbi:hypothetical protein ACFFV7_39075 [Nonomuraea spiralis]|uniref:Uncharacterized protein n=1 Tax=Nonomuraea spiralis TaxID=46182 RepID=A0ABV5ITL5_9ACTN|nr:hypothetical protein [Nonomuraea spiralis]GGT42651.1 hypothetical protein GCM10010176_102700 [Nonomuraea spiralis]
MSCHRLALSVAALAFLALGTAACGGGSAAVADTKGCKELRAVMTTTLTELQSKAGDLEAMKQLYSESARKLKELNVDEKVKEAQDAAVSLYEELAAIGAPEEADQYTAQASETVSKLNSACAA